MVQRIDWRGATKQTEIADRTWLQTLSVEDSNQLYCSLARFALSQREDSEGWKRLEEQSWQEKLAYRLKLRRALRIVDSKE